MLMPRAPAIERRLARNLAKAVRTFDMIREGDRILVGMSGGKDSYVLFHLLDALAPRAPIHFTIVPVHVDQNPSGHDPQPLIDYLHQRGYELRVETDDASAMVRNKTREGKSPCTLCARVRRAILYRLADELGCGKIALGHHRDDAIVTFMLNLVFSGQLKSMPPKLVSDDQRHIVIRPLMYCPEEDIERVATSLSVPIVSCGVCGTPPTTERDAISALLTDFERKHPGARANMIAALANVRPSHLLDPGLWNALGLQVATEQAHDPALPPTDRGW